MNVQTQPVDIRKFLIDHMANVFKTMLSMEAILQDNGKMPEFKEHITGSVGLGGDAISGALYFHLAADVAHKLAAAMLQLPAEELGEPEINDVVGELTNILTGQLKSFLCDAGFRCAVSTPSIIRGASYEVELLPSVRRELLPFRCDAGPLAVEVHIKYN
jgi:CheY-specific phosphatase CheX